MKNRENSERVNGYDGMSLKEEMKKIELFSNVSER